MLQVVYATSADTIVKKLHKN